jgi:hypothetical protein
MDAATRDLLETAGTALIYRFLPQPMLVPLPPSPCSGAIPALIPFLSSEMPVSWLEADLACSAAQLELNSAFQENANQSLLTMYYLCQLKISRQEQAALSGERCL